MQKMILKLLELLELCHQAQVWIFLEKNFPDRMFDVGIAEQHAVTFAAGLSN